MRHLIIAAVASVGIGGFVATGFAQAQVRPPTPQSSYPQTPNPVLSPYLNLLPRSPAVNYYGVVRPQQQYNFALNSLEQQVALNRIAITAAENQALPSTGHPIYFLNYQRFFLNTGAVAPFQNLQATVGAGGGAGLSSTAGQR